MEKVLISFSGGETSAYMTYVLMQQFKGWKEMIVVFANTGEEDERTLEFVDKCDKTFGWNVVWVEAVINKGMGNGTKHKIVTFETASRNGEPFREMIEKYGIPNIKSPHCSRELKGRAITSYMRSIGWKNKDYRTVIGIRADEIDRMAENYKKKNIWYPLVEFGTTKPFINRWWRERDFRLELKGYEGNCKVCWKKTLRKHLTIAKEAPERFDNFKIWEHVFEDFTPESRIEEQAPPYRFFRNNLTVENIFELSKKPFTPYPDDNAIFNETIQLGLFEYELDKSSGCVEDCNPFK